MEKAIGLTKDAGWQFGIRRTFPVTRKHAWDFMLSPAGIKTWLGDIDNYDLELDKVLKTSDGIEGKITVLKPMSHWRMSWKKKGWDHTSMLQVRVMGNDRATIVFHHDHLKSESERVQMKKYWEGVLRDIETQLTT